ncbi:hypothetical protein N7537_001519 [Penicillium hordei]|uniref:Uncharacterized protein n=1 Tax=Penicillium hordei TaxID=40994 RepID=A0AAD6EGT6_9EURO|nr:uncharacterized protein N7537_001519 [Penicillium hordei]KAJ5616405.1 hypothetical protein N7537_001519 [Penicillium hordei]
MQTTVELQFGAGLSAEMLLPEENATALRCIHQIKLVPQIMAHLKLNCVAGSLEVYHRSTQTAKTTVEEVCLDPMNDASDFPREVNC